MVSSFPSEREDSIWEGNEEKQNEKKIVKNQGQTQIDDVVEWEDFSNEDDKTEKTKWGEILFSSLLVIIFTILLCIKISVRLTYEKETMILAGMAVDLAAFSTYVL